MKTRIITAAVALALFIVILLLPPIVFTIALAGVIFMMLYECYTATKADTAMKVVGFISAAMLMFRIYVYSNSKILYHYRNSLIPVIIMVIILTYMTLVIFKHGKRSYKDILASGFLTMYIVFSMACVWLAKETWGTQFMLLIFVCAWSTDTFAYFTGRFFGKHKLIPHVSPNKTVEGSIGGVIGAAIACLVYMLISSKIIGFYSRSDIVMSIAFGIIGGALSQFGDLAASAIKRDTEIKDFGWIFPGHGGFMDRFDSVMYIAPVLHIVVILSMFLV